MDPLLALGDLGLHDARPRTAVPTDLARAIAHADRRARRRRPFVVALALSGAAIAAGVVVASGALDSNAGTRAGSPVLYRLAGDSLRAAPITSRYVVRSETDSESDLPGGGHLRRTVVIDARTGASVTYQTPLALGGGVTAPTVIRAGARSGHPEGWYRALPTTEEALRSRLLSMALGERRIDERIARRHGADHFPAAASDPALVYEQASDLLWSPLVQTTLRAALYRVIAMTPGVDVDAHATDPAGRPAIELRRGFVEDRVDYTITTWEDPRTGATLAQDEVIATHNREQLADGRVIAVAPTVMRSTYGSARGATRIPADPYVR